MKRLVLAAAIAAALALPCGALAGNTLPGKYTAKVTTPAQLKGTWTLTFAKATYTVAQNGVIVVRGHYTRAGAKITLSNESGPLSCPAAGKYSWLRTGKWLALKKLSDSKCAGRAGILGDHVFKAA